MAELISIIIPVYNVSEYLDQCLESVCGQTYTNLEIILVDDGSTDGSAALCDEWAAKDSRIIVIHQENAGVAAARNAGLAGCTGELLTFVDSDDWLDVSLLEKLHDHLVSGRADVAMCGFVKHRNGQATERGVLPASPADFKGALYQIMRKNGYYASVWGKLYLRRRVFSKDSYLRFEPDLSYGEDIVWLIELLRNCGCIVFLPQDLYHYRIRTGSITNAEGFIAQDLSLLKSCEKIVSLLSDDQAAQKLAANYLFNNCYKLKVLAYLSGDRASMQHINRTLKPMWRTWLSAPNNTLARKMKTLLLETEMLCHLPKALVHRTNNLQREQSR